MKTLSLVALLVVVVWGVADAGSPPDIYYNDFEFLDEQFCNRVALVCFNQNGQNGTLPIQPGEQSNLPSNGGVGRGTLGSGVLTGFTEIQSNETQVVNDPTNCHGGSWCTKVTLPTPGVVGSEFTVNTGYWRTPSQPNQAAQGCTGFNAPAGCFTNNYFFHWWTKWQPNFALTPLNSLGCQGKLFYAQSDPGNHSGPGGGPPSANAYGILVFRMDTGNSHIASLTWETNVGNQGHTTLDFSTGAWHEFEVQIDITNQHVNVWIDGTQFVSANVAFVQGFGVDINRWGMYINRNTDPNTGAPLDQCVLSQASGFWVDDIGVGTQRIGGASVNVPGTPSGLTVSG